jgi:hypothetical protein
VQGWVTTTTARGGAPSAAASGARSVTDGAGSAPRPLDCLATDRHSRPPPSLSITTPYLNYRMLSRSSTSRVASGSSQAEGGRGLFSKVKQGQPRLVSSSSLSPSRLPPCSRSPPSPS